MGQLRTLESASPALTRTPQLTRVTRRKAIRSPRAAGKAFPGQMERVKAKCELLRDTARLGWVEGAGMPFPRSSVPGSRCQEPGANPMQGCKGDSVCNRRLNLASLCKQSWVVFGWEAPVASGERLDLG